jgi:hypothetical protein
VPAGTPGLLDCPMLVRRPALPPHTVLLLLLLLLLPLLLVV